ncbi:MAG: VWA domain-containing protein, partial [Anaerolineales bacterium]|nr:VWA domain-containing protein [Anaerolineales bacterium]
MSNSRDRFVGPVLLTVLVVVALVLGSLPITVFAAGDAPEVSDTVTPTSPTGLGDSGANYQPIFSAAQMQLLFPNPLAGGGNYVLLRATVEIRARSTSSSSSLVLRVARASDGAPVSDTVSFSSSFSSGTITADHDSSGLLVEDLQSQLASPTIALNLLASRGGEIDQVRLTLEYEPITAGPVIQGECTAADIHLVVDHSGSIGNNISTYKQNIKTFMADVEAGMPGTNWRVTWFGISPNGTGTATSAWTANPAELTSFIDEERTKGYTPTANGINAAVAGGLVPPAPMVDNANNVMIVLTDGAPNVVLGGPAGLQHVNGGAAAIEQAELARAAGWSTLTVAIGNGDPKVTPQWAANVNRGIAGVDVAGPSGDVLSVADFGGLATELIGLLAPGCERTVIVGKVVDPRGAVADTSAFSGKIDDGTAQEKTWSAVGFGQFSAPIKVLADQFHDVTEDVPASPWSLTGWAEGSFDNVGAPSCPADPSLYTGSSIRVPAADPSNYSSVVVCVMNYATPAPGIDIKKYTNDEDADEPTGPYIAVGGAVTWKYVVTNTGNVDLTNLVITDDHQGVTVQCTHTDFLAPGASMT